MADAVTRLEGVKVKTVGLVDKGANGLSFAIVKRALGFEDLPVIDEEPSGKNDAAIIDDILGPDDDNFEAMDAVHLWRDDEAIAERDGEITRGDYKLLVGERGSDDVLRIFYSKLVSAFQAINGARSPIAIPIEDAERAFANGVRYVRKLNDALAEDEQKPIPEFAGVVQQGAHDMADNTEKAGHEDEEDGAAEGSSHEFPALQALAAERLTMLQDTLEELKGFADMSKDDVNDKLFAMSDMLWGMHGDLVILAKSQGVTIQKSALGDFLRAARDEAEISNEDLAGAAEIEVAAVAAILAGEDESPPESYLAGFATVLPGVTAQDLIDLLTGDEEDPEVEAQMAKEDEGGIQKRVDSAVSTALAKREKEHTAELAKRDTAITALQDTNRLAELVVKAKDEFPSLGDPIEVAKRLQKIEKALGEDELTAELEVLKGYEAKAKAGLDHLTKSAGRGGKLPEGSPEDVLEKRVTELVKDGTVDSIAKAYLHIASNEGELITATKEE